MSSPKVAGQSILSKWKITEKELTSIVNSNPSLRGMLIGYIAEHKLSKLIDRNPKVKESYKYDDHDRTKKGDRIILYKNHKFIIECKSLQTDSIKKVDGQWIGKAQVDASDSRTVILKNDEKLKTTLLLAGEFDILAVNLFAFDGKWRFIYARNKDLPKTRYYVHPTRIKKQLLASSVKVSWPPEHPFHEDLFKILDELVRNRTT